MNAPKGGTGKCVWCGVEGRGMRQVKVKLRGRDKTKIPACSAECQRDFEKFNLFMSRYIFVFLILIFGWMIASIGLLFTAPPWNMVAAYIGLVGMGVSLIIFPFSNLIYPFTSSKLGQKWGLRKSVRVTRMGALAVTLVALVFLAVSISTSL